MLQTVVENKTVMEAIYCTPAMITEARQGLQMSLSEFGAFLARRIDPRAAPFTRQYISGLEHGRFRITDVIGSVILSLLAREDGVPIGLGGAGHASVLARPGQIPEGTYIPSSAVVPVCPGCGVRFLRVHNFQIYHEPNCGKKGT